MTVAQESGYMTPALFAAASYCAPSTTINWSCGGAACHLLLLSFRLAGIDKRSIDGSQL